MNFFTENDRLKSNEAIKKLNEFKKVNTKLLEDIIQEEINHECIIIEKEITEVAAIIIKVDNQILFSVRINKRTPSGTNNTILLNEKLNKRRKARKILISKFNCLIVKRNQISRTLNSFYNTELVEARIFDGSFRKSYDTNMICKSITMEQNEIVELTDLKQRAIEEQMYCKQDIENIIDRCYIKTAELYLGLDKYKNFPKSKFDIGCTVLLNNSITRYSKICKRAEFVKIEMNNL